MEENKIREARLETGLTQRRTAELLGVPLRNLERWEAGDRQPASYVEKMLLEKMEDLKIFCKRTEVIKEKLEDILKPGWKVEIYDQFYEDATTWPGLVDTLTDPQEIANKVLDLLMTERTCALTGEYKVHLKVFDENGEHVIPGKKED